MVTRRCVCPNYGLTGQSDTQFWMENSGHPESSEFSLSQGPIAKPSLLLQRRMVIGKKRTWIFYKSLKVCTVTPPYRCWPETPPSLTTFHRHFEKYWTCWVTRPSWKCSLHGSLDSLQSSLLLRSPHKVTALSYTVDGSVWHTHL